MSSRATGLKSVGSNPTWVQIRRDRSGFHYLVSISGRNSSCLRRLLLAVCCIREKWLVSIYGTGAAFQLRHPMQTIESIRLSKLICRRGKRVSHLLCLPLPDQLKTAGIFPKPSRYGYMTDILSHNVALARGLQMSEMDRRGS